MKWKLEPGRIRCDEDSVLILHDTPDFKVFEIDLDSKYPGSPQIMTESGQVTLMIFPVARTRNVNMETDLETTFSIIAEGEDWFDWTLLSEANRYTWRIVMYNGKPTK